MNNQWKEYIKEQRINYRNIGYVRCPVFDNEKTYFNHYGFDHILYKNGVPRAKEEVIKRFQLLPYAYAALMNTKYVFKEEKRVKGASYAYFWTIKDTIKHQRVRIILRRLGDNGILHFFSVMEE